MNNRFGANVIEFPAEYLTEQRKLDRWMAITSCSIVMGSDEPMACVEMILDKFGDAPTPGTVAHVCFTARTMPAALIDPDDVLSAASAETGHLLTENVYNEWIDAWLPRAPRC